jgi:hypothetical protein
MKFFIFAITSLVSFSAFAQTPEQLCKASVVKRYGEAIAS